MSQFQQAIFIFLVLLSVLLCAKFHLNSLSPPLNSLQFLLRYSFREHFMAPAIEHTYTHIHLPLQSQLYDIGFEIGNFLILETRELGKEWLRAPAVES